MPRQDGTGPNSEGPKTGRGLGPCKPDAKPSVPKSDKPGFGLGSGQGQGLGRRRRSPFGK